ncbi:MAG: Lar family restriction alleviation protein [Methylovulum miyakonense]|uniref:Lar family restriction alleviation protein n=1 Tax=Methylovulum miyakonense TaxID=645578 RepID=UPI003BB7C298
MCEQEFPYKPAKPPVVKGELNTVPLLDCPFCGKPAELKTEFENNGLYRSRIEIGCAGCGANIHSIMQNTGTGELRQLQYDTLVLKWNARVNPEDDYATITQTRELIDTLSHYARYTDGNEESIWVCEYCEEVHVDPYEQDCACYREGDA